jgi:hypothetical protein
MEYWMILEYILIHLTYKVFKLFIKDIVKKDVKHAILSYQISVL